MVLLTSSDAEFLKEYPVVELKSTNNKFINTADMMGKNGLVIIFTCNHCPYAIALWDRLIRDYTTIKRLGFNLITINPNIHPDYPEDSFKEMVKLSHKKDLPFNYLVDEKQETAKSFDAQCTPDLFVLDSTHKLLYRGAYDDNWKNSTQVKETFLLNALNEFNNENISFYNGPKSMGCSIKWVKN